GFRRAITGHINIFYFYPRMNDYKNDSFDSFNLNGND
ncbi:MAG: hypothetical protein ACI90V_009090, partial [Bacillariaceae sp.]